jgi:hypothetical protein
MRFAFPTRIYAIAKPAGIYVFPCTVYVHVITRSVYSSVAGGRVSLDTVHHSIFTSSDALDLLRKQRIWLQEDLSNSSRRYMTNLLGFSFREVYSQKKANTMIFGRNKLRAPRWDNPIIWLLDYYNKLCCSCNWIILNSRLVIPILHQQNI